MRSIAIPTAMCMRPLLTGFAKKNGPAFERQPYEHPAESMLQLMLQRGF